MISNNIIAGYIVISYTIIKHLFNSMKADIRKLFKLKQAKEQK